MATRRKTPTTLTETLRQAIADSGLPFAELERQSGVIRQSLMKFVRNEQSLRLDMADKLAEFFALELVERKVK
jgi:plasmid maintenance system antidote protein VapI